MRSQDEKMKDTRRSPEGHSQKVPLSRPFSARRCPPRPSTQQQPGSPGSMGRGGAVATPGVAWDVHVRPRSRAGFSAPEPAVDAAAAGFSGGDGRKSHVYRGSCLPKGSAAAQTRQRPAKKLNPLPSRATAGSGVARVMSAPVLRPVTASAPCSMLATMNLPLDTTSELSLPPRPPAAHTIWRHQPPTPRSRRQAPVGTTTASHPRAIARTSRT